VKRFEWNEAEGRLEEVVEEVFEQGEENNGVIQGDGVLLTVDKRVDLNLLKERVVESKENLPQEEINKEDQNNSNLN